MTPADLSQLGELIRTQDNRITSHPVFVVEQQRTVWAVDTDYDHDGFDWLDADGPVSDRKRARLERLHHAGGDTGKYRRLGFKHYWEFVTACFTEQGCTDYLASNGHNLKSPRVYVYSGWRNQEWQRLREFLAAMEPEKGALADAAREVLSHRVGEQPVRGWLHDTDTSRTALTKLAAALAVPAPARTGTVADYPDDHLLRRAVRHIARNGRRREFAWTRVMDVFGLGSTYSAQLCRRSGIDPDTGKDIEPLG